MTLEGCTCPACTAQVVTVPGQTPLGAFHCPTVKMVHSLPTLAALIDDAWKPEAQTEICMIQRSVVSNKRGLELIGKMLQIHTYDKGHAVAVAMASAETGKNRASDVLVFLRYPERGMVAESSAVNRAASEHGLNMVFLAMVGTVALSVLFDTGSTNCFMRRGLCAELKLKPHATAFKAVNTADGSPGRIVGSVDIPQEAFLAILKIE